MEPENPNPVWRTAYASQNGANNCVAVAMATATKVLIRDSKNPDGGMLRPGSNATDGFWSLIKSL